MSPNHRLVLDEIKGYVERQSQQMNMLDSKAGVVAATATALVAGFLALVNGGSPNAFRAFRLALGGHVLLLSGHTLHLTLYIIAFLSYAGVCAATFMATRLEDWETAPNPAWLLDNYWPKSADETVARLAATLEQVSSENAPRIAHKRKWVGRSYVALGGDLAILAVAALIGAWHLYCERMS